MILGGFSFRLYSLGRTLDSPHGETDLDDSPEDERLSHHLIDGGASVRVKVQHPQQ